MILCINKYRDKNNNITGYRLRESSSGKVIDMTATELKHRLSKGMKVSNLKLTSDNRVIDSDDYIEEQQKLNRNKKKIMDSYNIPGSESKLKYTLSKLGSPRVGKAMARALLIGMACASLTSVTTGCSAAPLDVNATSIETQAENTETLQDKIDKLNAATEIDVDVHNFSLTSKATIRVDGDKIGVISGKFVKIFDTMTFEDENGDTIATGDQDTHLVFDAWTIYDSEGNAMFRMKEELGLTKKYVIIDIEGNELAWLKKSFFTFSAGSAKVYDMEDNVIAEIKQYPMRKDFTIIIKDNSKIDNTSMTSICTNYMMEIIRESNSSKNHKNKSDD